MHPKGEPKLTPGSVVKSLITCHLSSLVNPIGLWDPFEALKKSRLASTILWSQLKFWQRYDQFTFLSYNIVNTTMICSDFKNQNWQKEHEAEGCSIKIKVDWFNPVDTRAGIAHEDTKHNSNQSWLTFHNSTGSLATCTSSIRQQ